MPSALRKRPYRRALLAVAALASTVLVATAFAPAQAGEFDQKLSGTASAMWQTNNDVNALAVSGGVLYAGGLFTNVRPPGAAAGKSQTARTYLAAFSSTTGALVTAFKVTLNGQVRALATSANGKELFVGGSFTTVNGSAHNRLVAINIPAGTIDTSFSANISSSVTALAISGTALFVGGDFSTANGVSHARIASLNATTGALTAGFTASADNRVVTIAPAPDGSRLYIGGSFKNVDGVAHNALASIYPATGTLAPLAASTIIPNTPTCYADVSDIVTNGTTAYVAGDGAQPGCFDGDVALNISDGTVDWVNYCEGATQALVVLDGWLYKGSHMHDCAYGTGGNDGGFVGSLSQGTRVWYRLETQSLSDGTFAHWSPDTNGAGPVHIGPHVFATDGTQIFVGGDFTTVNNRNQQGLTRFTNGDTAPARPAAPTVVGTASGTLAVSFHAVVDPDNGTLTYSIYRDGGATAIAKLTAESWYWTQPTLRYYDTGLNPGSSHTYQILASDGTLSSAKSTASAGAAVPNSNPTAYSATVLGASPSSYWRLDDSGSTAVDGSPNGATGTFVGGVATGAGGALAGNAAVTLDGSTGYVSSTTPAAAPTAFTEEAWFKTSTLSGGDILGFSDSQTGAGISNDRVIYLDDDGQLVGAIHTPHVVGPPGSRPTPPTIRTPNSYNDGTWHQAVLAYDGTTLSFYVDGNLVGTVAATQILPGSGYLRAGYTNLASFNVVFGTNITGKTAPNSNFLNGSVDEVAAFPVALSAAQAAAQYSGGLATHS